MMLYRNRVKRQLLSPKSLCTLDVREIAEACRGENEHSVLWKHIQNDKGLCIPNPRLRLLFAS